MKGSVAHSERTAACNEKLGGEETTIVVLRSETAEIEWSLVTALEPKALHRLGVSTVTS